MRLKSTLLPVCALLVLSIPAQAIGFDWEKAVSLYKQGQFRAAVAEFENVVAEFPNHSDSWKFIGLALYQLQDYEKAMPALEKAMALKQAEGKSDPDILLALSRVQISMKKYDQAIASLENLAKQRPDLASNHYMLGVAYANVNRNEEAMQAFRAAIKLAPQDPDAWHYLSIQLFRLNRPAEALAALRNGLASAPKNAQMMSMLADALLRQAGSETTPTKADPLIEEAVRVATSLRAARDDSASSELLGRALLAGKKYAPAEQSLQRAISLSKQPDPALYYNLGYAQAQLKEWPKAVESFEQADRLGLQDVNNLYYLGFVYENQRKYPEALRAYTRAYELGGRTNADIKASIDRIAPYAKP